MTKTRLLAVVTMLASMSAFAGAPDAAALFSRLKKLEGSWKSGGKDAPTFVTLRVIGKGNAVLETVTGADRSQVTDASVFFLEGGELFVSTFAAGAPNKLKARADGEGVRFEAGKDAKPASGTVGVALLPLDADRLTHAVTSTAGGKEATASIELTREYVDTLK